MSSARATRQHGAALLLLLAVIVLGSSWYLVSRLNVESGMANAAAKTRNTQVLNRAKQALIGYIATQANFVGETRPGALPCPEAPANFNVSGSEGTVSYPCTLPIVGRFPWRTLGMDKLVDAYGEPLWYAVAAGWAGAATVINSDCASPSAGTGLACSSPGGRLSVDGMTNDVIALIISPGRATKVTASAGCAAWTQTRPTTAPPDWRNYLECENASSPADATFVTTSTNSSFNDQVVTITVGDLMPALEASIANRIEREIVPALNAVYPASAAYPTSGWVLSATTRSIYPYAAPFSSPDPGTSNYLGVASTYQGLLPFNQTQGCVPATNPRCLPSLITWQGIPGPAVEVGFGYIGPTAQSCSWQSGGEVRECTGDYHEDDGTTPPPHTTNPANPIRIEMTAIFNNVALGLRAIDTTKMTVEARDDTCAPGCPWQPQVVTYTTTMNTNGSVTLTFGATLPNIDVMGWGSYAQFRIRIDRAAVGDHALLDTANATVGWFARNEWFRQIYYAVSPAYATGNSASLRLPPTCNTGATGVAANDCLSVANLPPVPPYLPNGQRAILILGGRSLNGTSRPSATLANYLELGNATGAYTRNTVRTAIAIPAAQRFNDRIVVVGSN
jgi:hypothetical protein